MELRVLGNVEATLGGRPLGLGGAKQRAVLAMLALEANRTVTTDRLIDGLWAERPPASASKMVQNYVWRLRKTLGEDGAEIVTHGRGYELRIDAELVDVHRFERLIAEAARTATAGEPTNAAREALALLRGAPLADVADEPFAAAEIRRLDDLRLTAAELAIDADLAAGRHHEAIAEIEALLHRDPLREHVHAQRIVALYRCGRQAAALEAYRDARRTLVDEIGVEPGPELRDLHEAVLRQDPSLDVSPAVADLPPALDAEDAPPLSGRDGELRRLRAHWDSATGGAGGLVAIVGGYGMGKTRLAGALAAYAHAAGAAVLYAAGTGTRETVMAALARVRGARRPTLLVVDDADRAAADVRAMLADLAPVLGSLPVLVLATGQEAAELGRLNPRETIALQALDEDAVRAIAQLYAPADAAAVPVEALLAESQGVPRRVQEAASEWARREATRRVDAVAGRAAVGRSEARALEAELAGSVVDLQSARDRSRRLAGATTSDDARVVCPYKGLATFDVDDADYFFGRERLVAELVARLVGAPLLGIVGPSGSGKSSVMRAGLLPALAGGVLPGSERWAQAVMRPGEHPMRELRRVARGLGQDRRGILAIDQFEEVFTACHDGEERSSFVEAIVDAARDRDGRLLFVIAIRADLYGSLAAYPDLARLVGANTVLVGPMSRDELGRAVEQPARRTGLVVEPELVDALLRDVEAQPGGLPLLSTALLELWQQRDERRLRLATYVRSGGVHGAVARLAEAAFLELRPDRRAILRRVLLRLAGETDDGVVVRRRVALSELEAAPGRPVSEVIAHLTKRRLVTLSEGAVEVAHEALLREWPRLRGWLDEDAEGRRLHRRIGNAARAWDTGGRDPGELYRGTRLSAALDWRAGHDAQLNATERAFLDAARTAHERANRRLRLALGGVSLLLVAAIAATVLALHQRADARAKERTAAAQALDTQALGEPALDRALLLARQAVGLVDSPATRGNLLTALLRSPAAIGVLRGDGRPLLSLALSPDGRTVAVAEDLGTVRFYDTASRRPTGPPYDDGKARIPQIGYSPDSELAYSPDGTRLAVADTSFPDGGFIDVLDARSHRRIARLTLGSPPGGGGGAAPSLKDVTFSPDSRVLVAHTTSRVVDGRGPAELVRWNVRTGRLLDRRIVGRHFALIGFVGRARLVTSDASAGTVVLRDALTLRPLRRFGVATRAHAAAVSPDGRLAALGAPDGSVRILDLRSGNVRTASGGDGAPVRDARFTPDGRTLVTVGEDAKVTLWGVPRARASETLTGHTGPIRAVAVSPDGRSAYTASLDGTVIAWDLAGSRRLGRPFHAAAVGHGGSIGGVCGSCGPTTPDDGNLPPSLVAATPDGRTVAIPGSAGNVILYDGGTLARRGAIPVDPGGRIFSLAIAPNGRTLVATGWFGEVAFWDLRARRALGPAQVVHVGPVWTPTFSSDGLWMATTGEDRNVRLWDLRRRRPVASVQATAPVDDVGLSPDGRTLAVTTGADRGQGSVDIYSVPRLSRVAALRARWGRWGRFTPDGHVLVVADHEGRLRLFDTATWKLRAPPVDAHSREILSVAISPDGRTLATTSLDGTARLWDTASGRQITDGLPGPPNRRSGAVFVGGGSRLLVAYDDGRALLWDLRPSTWTKRACSIAGRILTRAEWRDALPDRAYAPACRSR